MFKLAALGLVVLLAAPAWADPGLKASLPRPARGNSKLDLDIYSWNQSPSRSSVNNKGPLYDGWLPGDPRAERGQSEAVQHLSHVGYAGLGAAGLAASIASGGVAPAIGFGIVTAVQSFLEWRQIKRASRQKS